MPRICIIFIILADRLTVGRLVLVQVIGVRVPVRQLGVKVPIFWALLRRAGGRNVLEHISSGLEATEHVASDLLERDTASGRPRNRVYFMNVVK